MPDLVFMYAKDAAPAWINLWFPSTIKKEIYDPKKSYPENTVFYYDMYGAYSDTLVQHLRQGHRVIYDAKNEHYVHSDKQWVLDVFQAHPEQGMFLISGHSSKNIPGVRIQATPYWYWILDQDHFRHFDYDKYQPCCRPRYKFFMQMSLDRPDRDELYRRFQPVLADALHSYRSRGVFLPNDYTGPGNWQRYMNFDWIDQTCFTVSVETYIQDNRPTGYSLTNNDNWFVCEKSFKAIAVHHPFLLASTQGNLAYLRSLGFETFPELWDESYDDLEDYCDRLDCLVTIIQEFDQGAWQQQIVQQKLQHNRDRFFDRSLTTRFCLETIVEPVLEFLQ